MPAAKKRRVGRPRSKSAPAVLRSPRRPAKRKQWTNEAMVAALEAVKQGETILRAARTHGVPRTTLQDRVHGKVTHGAKPGPKPYLAPAEEKELSLFIVDVAKAGYGKTRQQIKAIAENVANEKGTIRSKKVTDGWFKRFMDRHPKLSLRKGDATANVRMECLNPDMMKQYFDLLKDALEKHGLMDSPAQIYNVDETGMPLDHRPPKIVTKKGQKKVRYRTSGNKSQITVIGCVSAVGQAIPPFVIFDAKNLNAEWTEGEVAGTTYGLSEKGWVDTELFRGWLVDHFLKHAVAARPLFLLLDGHSSHYQPDLIHFAKDHNIVLFCLPPHTTHESQPLDTTVFGPLKRNWQSVCHQYMQSNPGKIVTKYQFSALLNKAWMLTMTPSNICAGFRKCGVYLFNSNAIDCGLMSSSTVDDGGDSSSYRDRDDDGDGGNANEGGVGDNLENGSEFSAEKELLFQQRHEEGYDVYDPEYVRWLEVHHPADVPHDRYHLVPIPTSTSNSVVDSFTSVVPLSPLILPPSGGELAVTSELPRIPSCGAGLLGSSHAPPSGADLPGPSRTPPSEADLPGPSRTPPSEADLPGSSRTPSSEADLPGLSGTPPFGAGTPGSSRTPPSRAGTPGSSRTPPSGAGIPGSSRTPPSVAGTPGSSHTPPSVAGTPGSSRTPPFGAGTPGSSRTPPSGAGTPGSSRTPPSVAGTPGSSRTPPSGADTSGSPEQLKYISKYLVQYVPCPPQKKAEAKWVGGARILTSSECVSILKEREEKKRIEAEEKEKRKIERERKKREREEMVKRKAEERAKKAAERSSRLTKRAAPKATTAVSKKRKVVKDSFPSCLEPGSERKDDEDPSASVPQSALSVRRPHPCNWQRCHFDNSVRLRLRMIMMTI